MITIILSSSHNSLVSIRRTYYFSFDTFDTVNICSHLKNTSVPAFSGQLLLCHTNAELWVLSNQRWFLAGEGGTDSSETHDDRSALPLMCTYLPIGELCQGSNLCLKSPCTLWFPSPPTLSVPTPSQCSLTPKQSQGLLSHTSTQSGSQGERWIYLWEEFESIIYSHSLCLCFPSGRLYRMFMNDRVYQCTASSCLNTTQQTANSCCHTKKTIYCQALNLNGPDSSAYSVHWAVWFWYFILSFHLFSLFIPPSLSVESGLIKAMVVLLLQYHVRGYQHTKPFLAEAREKKGRGEDQRSSYSHPTPPLSPSSLGWPNPSLACPSQNPNSSSPLPTITNHHPPSHCCHIPLVKSQAALFICHCLTVWKSWKGLWGCGCKNAVCLVLSSDWTGRDGATRQKGELERGRDWDAAQG